MFRSIILIILILLSNIVAFDMGVTEGFKQAIDEVKKLLKDKNLDIKLPDDETNTE